MDSVRFGRALGAGARSVAKAAVGAAEAVAAPSRRGARTAAAPVRVRDAAMQTVGTARGLRQGGKKFGEAVWGPFAKLSGVLWLEVMGVLFGMVAALAGVAVWQGRGSLRPAAEGLAHEVFGVVMLGLFGYFAVSSFVRASRRSRGTGRRR